MECIIPECVRTTDTDYCKKHQLAEKNMKETFEQWQVAYGETFSWEDYLERLAEDYEVGSGRWVIEVAEYLLEDQE